MKYCPKCKTEKPRSDFHRNRAQRDGLATWCKQCSNTTSLATHRHRKYYAKHHIKWNQNRRQRSQSYREQAILRYGGKCACCGESHLEFLTFDHVNNDGSQMRKERGDAERGGTLYKRLITDPVIDLAYQVLCWNCNLAKAFYGYCPHLNN
jgi:hypothetical protein